MGDNMECVLFWWNHQDRKKKNKIHIFNSTHIGGTQQKKTSRSHAEPQKSRKTKSMLFIYNKT